MSTPAHPPLRIYASMIAIMQEVEAIAKNQRNTAQNFNFRGIDDCYQALHPLLAKHGVICVPIIQTVVPSQFENAKGNVVHQVRMTIEFRFTAMDGSYIGAIGAGEAMDFGDKATAKAASAAHKQVLLQTFLVPVTNIEDGDRDDYTADPREELDRLEKMREAVVSGNGEQELNAEDAAALLKKRREIAESAKIAGDEGITIVTPVQQPDLVAQAKPAKVTEPETPPFEPDVVDWRSHKISVIKVPEFKDVLVGAMEPKDVLRLFKGWVIKQGLEALIAKGPEFAAEARALNAAMLHHFPKEHAVLTAPKQ